MKKTILALALAIPIAAYGQQDDTLPSRASVELECRNLVEDLVEVAENRISGVPVWVTFDQYSFLPDSRERVMFIYTAPREAIEDTGRMYAELYSSCLQKRGYSL